MANSVESTARHDAQAFKHGGDKGDHSKALQSVADHAHSMSTKDLKTEQAYWNSLGKASHDHLPGLSIHRNNDGNVDSVKNAAGESMYDRNAEVKKTVDSNHATLKNGQGPFDAFKAQGLSDREASENAKKVMEATGRKTFHAGEKLGVHGDDVTTSSHDKKSGTTTEDRYNKDGSHENKVTQKNGDSSTTITKDNKVTGIQTHTTDATTGKSTDTKYSVDGDKKTRTEQTVTDKNGDTHTTHFRKDGSRYDTQDVENGGKKTTTKDFDEKGNMNQSTVVDQEKGTITKTQFDKDLKKTHERVDGPNGFSDTTWKDGKQTEKIDHTNGKNGAFQETREFGQKDDPSHLAVTIDRGETNAKGGYHEDRIEVTGKEDPVKGNPNAHTRAYSWNMTDANNGTGTITRGGPGLSEQNQLPHVITKVNGVQTEGGIAK